MFRRLLTRLGYASLGAVYVVLGFLAARAAALALLGGSPRVRGFPAAFRYLLARRDGPEILAAVAAGLFAFTVARILDAVDRRTPMLARLTAWLDALAHGVLAWMAFTLLLRLRRGVDARLMLVWVLAQPWGSGVLQIAGVVVVALGGFQIFQGLSGKLRLQPSRRKLGTETARAAVRVGRFGYASRGVATAIIGWFLFRVGQELDPRRYRDIGGALEALQSMEFGSLLLGLAGLGLVAYGAYLALLGFFRHGV